jgi:hypothetical protein
MGRLALVCLALLLVVSPAPAGFVNLITNGDFSLGNTGFTSDYTYTPGNLGASFTYDILANLHSDHPAAASYGAKERCITMHGG